MVEQIKQTAIQYNPSSNTPREMTLIDAEDIKAILYLGLRGEISLPIEKHNVDILA
ncbi:MAG: hypothetical protein AB1798_12030 [Spirochaetota bacterium]